MSSKPKTSSSDDEKQNVVKSGGNLTKLLKDVKKAADRVIKLKGERSAINEIINEITSGLVGNGITKRAFNRALQDLGTQNTEDGGADKRRADDEAYQIAREALGLPVQGDLFDPPAKQDDTAEGAAAKG